MYGNCPKILNTLTYFFAEILHYMHLFLILLGEMADSEDTDQTAY